MKRIKFGNISHIQMIFCYWIEPKNGMVLL